MNKYEKIFLIILISGTIIGIPVQLMTFDYFYGLQDYPAFVGLGILFVGLFFMIKAERLKKKNETNN